MLGQAGSITQVQRVWHVLIGERCMRRDAKGMIHVTVKEQYHSF